MDQTTGLGCPAVSGGICCCCCCLYILMGLTSIAPTEIALAKNNFWKTVDKQVYDTPGWKYVGPWTTMLRYPKTWRTIEFTKAKGSMLESRTNDGLSLQLGIAFQYKLEPSQLFELYQAFEDQQGRYEEIFKLMATHVITENATEYSAYEYFNNKGNIAAMFLVQLDAYYKKNLFASINALQINEDDLPVLFTDKVMEAAVKKMNIKGSMKYQESQKVVFETNIVVARGQANVTVNNANGTSCKIKQIGIADATIIETYVDAELAAYSNTMASMENVEGDRLIDYIWFDSLAGGGVASTQEGASTHTEILMGVNPNAYINKD